MVLSLSKSFSIGLSMMLGHFMYTFSHILCIEDDHQNHNLLTALLVASLVKTYVLSDYNLIVRIGRENYLIASPLTIRNQLTVETSKRAKWKGVVECWPVGSWTRPATRSSKEKVVRASRCPAPSSTSIPCTQSALVTTHTYVPLYYNPLI